MPSSRSGGTSSASRTVPDPTRWIAEQQPHQRAEALQALAAGQQGHVGGRSTGPSRRRQRCWRWKLAIRLPRPRQGARSPARAWCAAAREDRASRPRTPRARPARPAGPRPGSRPAPHGRPRSRSGRHGGSGTGPARRRGRAARQTESGQGADIEPKPILARPIVLHLRAGVCPGAVEQGDQPMLQQIAEVDEGVVAGCRRRSMAWAVRCSGSGPLLPNRPNSSTASLSGSPPAAGRVAGEAAGREGELGLLAEPQSLLTAPRGLAQARRSWDAPHSSSRSAAKKSNSAACRLSSALRSAGADRSVPAIA